MKRAVLSLFAFVASVSLFAGDVKAPWKLTTEERIQLRFGNPGTPLPSPRIVDGRKNPELLFPTELFTSFVRNAFVMEFAEKHRKWIRQESDDLFLSKDDWARFDPIVGSYVRALRQEDLLIKAIANDKRSENSELRRLRAASALATQEGSDALHQARVEFGKERFDRFLYKVIAPSKSLAYDNAPTDPLVEALRESEKNAQ